MKPFLYMSAALMMLGPLLFAAPPSNSSTADRLDSQRNQGLLITRVIPDSPAQRAGIVRGDILIKLGGRKVSTPGEVRQVLSEHSAGDTIIAVVIHGSRTEKLPVKLETRLYHPILGVDFSGGRIEPSSSQNGDSKGAYVDSVVPGGPAHSAGIRAGDIILAVDGTPVDSYHTLTQLIDSHSPGDQISIRVEQSNGQHLTLSVQLGKASSGKPLLGVRYSPVPATRSGLERLFHNFGPPKWFRYFGEPLFPNQMKGGSSRSGREGSSSA